MMPSVRFLQNSDIRMFKSSRKNLRTKVTPDFHLTYSKNGGPHYANMSVQYTAIFHGYKNDYFQMKNCNCFLIFAQNIDCGYTLEPPQ